MSSRPKKIKGHARAIRTKYNNDQRQLSHLSSSFPQIRSPSTAQNDPGANRSVTNDRSLLVNFTWLDTTYDIGGVAADEVALQCTGFGYLSWVADNGECLLVRCLYSPQSDGTILSPNDICAQYKERFKGYNFFAMVNNGGYGHVEFLNHKQKPELKFMMTMDNNLWYHVFKTPKQPLASKANETRQNAKIKTLTNRASYELWHNRLGHPSQHVMENLHKYADGVPRLKHNDLWRCASCAQGKLKKSPIGQKVKLPHQPPSPTSS